MGRDSSDRTMRAFAALSTSGERQGLCGKWFMQKIPPKGLN
jgi:hypothetical protein